MVSEAAGDEALLKYELGRLEPCFEIAVAPLLGRLALGQLVVACGGEIGISAKELVARLVAARMKDSK